MNCICMNIFDYILIPVARAASATDVPQPLRSFVAKLTKLVLNPVIILMFALALVYFLYGVTQFLLNPGESENRDTGKRHILWGLVGMLVMFGVYAILNIISGTFGLPKVNQ